MIKRDSVRVPRCAVLGNCSQGEGRMSYGTIHLDLNTTVFKLLWLHALLMELLKVGG